MAKHRQGATPPTSRHARDLAVLRRAAPPTAPLTTPPLAVPPAPPPVPRLEAPTRATLNWQAGPDESLLVPRRLRPDELPALPPAVRALIDLTAQGLPTPAALRQQLLAVDLDTLQAAICEGIHRWHTYQPRPAAS
jgi:hypothetical protein